MQRTFIVGFGESQVGLTDVGYTLFDQNHSQYQARTITGVYEIEGGNYGCDVTLPDNFNGTIFWDTGGTAPLEAADSIFQQSEVNAGTGPYQIQFHAHDIYERDLVAYISVRLGGSTYSVRTSTNGIGTIALALGTYSISVISQGFQGMIEDLEVSGSGTVDITLTPLEWVPNRGVNQF